MGNLLSNTITTRPTQPAPPALTVPPATTNTIMAAQNAQDIIDIQNEIISKGIPFATRATNITIEPFAIQQPLDLYQTPIYIPSNSSRELNDYVSTYNKSIALLDDPNRMTQANFDAYIHLQDKKIEKLQSAIASYPTNSQQQNNPIHSIKNLKTSASLNVEPYPDPATQTSLPTYYAGNGASTYPNYLIYTNNGCIQYKPNNASSKESASWSVQSCNSNLPGQRFNMQQVNNMAQYNSLIVDPNNASYKITDPNSSIFGFYVVNPEGSNDQCLQLNGDGLSVMPCNMDSSQRFKQYYHSINP